MKIKHDIHLHTHRSLCASRTINASDYVRIARELGLTTIGISDHFWDAAIPGASEWYAPQNYEHIATVREELEALRGEGVQLFFGCEAEYDPYHHGVSITEETAERMDYLLVPNSHTHMMMPKDLYEPHEKHAEFMVNAFREIVESPVARYITSIAHPFDAVCCPYDRRLLYSLISDDTYRRLFDRAAEQDIALEFNTSCFWDEVLPEPVLHMFSIAKECGCRFTFGSDAHGTDAHEKYLRLCTRFAKELSLSEKDIREFGE